MPSQLSNANMEHSPPAAPLCALILGESPCLLRNSAKGEGPAFQVLLRYLSRDIPLYRLISRSGSASNVRLHKLEEPEEDVILLELEGAVVEDGLPRPSSLAV